MLNFMEALKQAFNGDRAAEEKIENELLNNRLSPKEINYIQQLATDKNSENNSYVFYLAAFTYKHQQNYAKATSLYDLSISLGNTNAMNNRALMHCDGHGGAVDYPKAIALLDQAIVLRNKSAMNNRALMHCEGNGGPVDYPKAIALFDQAIALGNHHAICNRACMHLRGQGGSVDYAKAITLFDQAIAFGNQLAMCNRARMHCLGQGGPLDYSKAIALFDQAIALGDTYAMTHRAVLYHKGFGEPVNYNAAAYLYRKAYLLEKNDENREVAKNNLQLLPCKSKVKYHFAMLAAEDIFIRLMKEDLKRYFRFLAEDDLLSNTEKYSYVKQILKQHPSIKTKITDQNSITLLQDYFKAQTSPDQDTQVSSLMAIDASIWLYLVSYLSRADKASLRLVCQFFLRNVLSSPSVWQQWVEVNGLEMFQEKGKRFGWGTRPIYGAFFSSGSLPSSLPLVTALDFSQSDAFFKASSDALLTIFAKLPKQLKYLKLQYATNITQPVIRFLIQNYPDLYIDCPLPKSGRGDNVKLLTHPNENFSSYPEQMKLVEAKQWIHQTAIKIAHNQREAWLMAFQITLWLEYLALTPFSFSLQFDTQNVQSFALALIDVYLKGSCGLNMQDIALDLELKQFFTQEFTILKDELHALQLQDLVTLKPILKTLEKMLLQLPQTKQIQNLALNILSIYNITFFSILAEKDKVCAASLAMARFQILKNHKEAWPKEYVIKTKMSFDSFKEEYDLISKVVSTLAKTKMKSRNTSQPSNHQTDNLEQLDECLHTLHQDKTQRDKHNVISR